MSAYRQPPTDHCLLPSVFRPLISDHRQLASVLRLCVLLAVCG